MPAVGAYQDEFTKEELAQTVIPALEKGRYELNVGPDGRTKVSRMQARWVMREDVEQG